MTTAIKTPIKPELDQQFSPAVMWNRAYQNLVTTAGQATEVAIALLRPDSTCTVFRTEILPTARLITMIAHCATLSAFSNFSYGSVVAARYS